MGRHTLKEIYIFDLRKYIHIVFFHMSCQLVTFGLIELSNSASDPALMWLGYLTNWVPMSLATPATPYSPHALVSKQVTAQLPPTSLNPPPPPKPLSSSSHGSAEGWGQSWRTAVTSSCLMTCAPSSGMKTMRMRMKILRMMRGVFAEALARWRTPFTSALLCSV